MSFNRIFAIASNVLRETVRDQVLYLSLVYSAILVAAVFLLPQLAASGESKIIVDVGVAAIELVGLVVAVFVGTNLVNKEIDKRTIFVLVAKPVSRAEFVLGKHLGISLVLAVLVALMSAIFIAVMSLANVKIPVVAILVSNFFTFWQLMLLGAIAVLFGTFTSSLIAALLTFATYLAGNFSKDLLTLGEITQNESFKNVTRAIYLFLPDLSRANLKNEAVYGILPSVTDLFNNGIYILAYALLMLAIAILIFSNRQF
jgi:ABC-type transport system involved in multi-copper enzyme maturation permease subunit